ncbi:MAG: M24 family metallopeptidase [Mycoplasmatales bacterium]
MTITDKTFNYCLQFLKEGITEKEYANKLDFYHKEFGADGPSFNTIVAFGEHAALPHAQPGARKLKQGDIITVDYGCFYKGYCSDMTRTFFFGQPQDEELVKIHEIVLQAHHLQIAAIAPGKSTKEIDKIGRDLITEHGYGQTFAHGTGHGIGLEIHEAPLLNSVSDTILKEGMIITIEPGIYLEGKGGVRIENDIIVTKDGYESLNQTDRSLDVYNNTLKN